MSTKGRYGLRIMIELANNYGKGPQSVETIATHQHISGKYIHVIAMNLKSAGLLRTVRGPNGGYELAKNPSAITALDIVLALEGKNAPVDCVINAAYCLRANACVARDLWCDIATAIDNVLAGQTIEQLAQKQQAYLDTRHCYTI
ncbi:MAG: Rrf2 family transcriptional regulator [Deltaproteobacteria bacterium]|nr:Rrf2 family transcriptional regulator [Deltaproteobacteria bacterium]